VHIVERTLSLPVAPANRGLLAHLGRALEFRLGGDAVPIRFVITRSDPEHYECEVGLIERAEKVAWGGGGLFEFRKRASEATDRFVVVLIVPTGVGAEIGGHAGDAGPVARMLAEACDVLITHPNVVNASDINELPGNALYVEGSILTRLLMGVVGLQPVRSNRVISILHAHESEALVNAAVNAVNAARASYGLNCPKIVLVDRGFVMRSEYNVSGRASGEILQFRDLYNILTAERGKFDAVAISSVISVPPAFHQQYFDKAGEMVNPWGGVEALLTHSVSSLFNVPSAHSPMFESEQIANSDPGIVDPRMAAEAISLTFLQCVLKGLQRSPRLITAEDAIQGPGVLSARDVSCLVLPDRCVGLPTLAALEQGIPVIAVRDNQNLLRNDLTLLPWSPGQFHPVENYFEAAGVLAAIRAGVDPSALRRPLRPVQIDSGATTPVAKTHALLRR